MAKDMLHIMADYIMELMKTMEELNEELMTDLETKRPTIYKTATLFLQI
jgi:hypothetical protein